MTMVFDRHVALPGSYNIRDLGGYPTKGGRTTAWRRVLRADSLHRLEAAATEKLIEMGLTCVIDLRYEDEVIAGLNPFRGLGTVRYHHISLFDQLRPQQPRPTQESVAEIDLLLARYCKALKERRAAIADVLRIIADTEGLVLFHCTAGKDRTGIIAAFVLLAAGVARETICEDYALTGPLIQPMLDGLIAQARADGRNLDNFLPLLACDPETMKKMLDHLDEEYDGPGPYFELLGLDGETVGRLSRRLL